MSGTKCVMELSEELKYNQSVVSQNLRVLREASIVTIEQRGKYRFYTLEKKVMKHVMRAVQEYQSLIEA